LIHPVGNDLESKGRYIIRMLKKMFANLQPDILILEYPTFFSSMKGAIAATEGYTLDLAYIDGLITATFMNVATVKLYKPHEWKGQQPKSAIEFKYKRKYPELARASRSIDEIEAMMMIDFYLKTTYGI